MGGTEIQDRFTSRSTNDDLEGQETAGLFLPELTFKQCQMEEQWNNVSGRTGSLRGRLGGQR